MWSEADVKRMRGLEQQPGSRERGKTQSVAFRFLLSLFLLTADAAWLFPHVSPRPCGLETVGSELLLGTAREAPSHSGGERWHPSGCAHPAALRAAAEDNRGTAVSPLTFHPNIRVTISGKEYHFILQAGNISF